MNKFRIIPKRDFGSHGFLIGGKWVKTGFVVTLNGGNCMPGSTWFRSIADAMDAIDTLIGCNGNAKLFWERVRK